MSEAPLPPDAESVVPPDGPIEFPCDYQVKLIGRHTPEFREQVRAIIARFPPHEPAKDEERISRDANFLSLTCHVHVTSRSELDALYRELHATGHVLYAL